jgi:hypothetical protein
MRCNNATQHFHLHLRNGIFALHGTITNEFQGVSWFIPCAASFQESRHFIFLLIEWSRILSTARNKEPQQGENE